MSNDKIIDISARRLKLLNSKEAPQGIGAMGDLMKKFLGVDLLKVAVIMKTIEPLLRIERQAPKRFERKQGFYLKILNTYDEKTYLHLIHNSNEEQWKRRPIFFAGLVEKVFGKKIPDFP